MLLAPSHTVRITAYSKELVFPLQTLLNNTPALYFVLPKAVNVGV